ncbi:MAG: hypothetical protein M5U34_36540 [Chloroflexi bacterium]|nr:hypothetical protein [Chloroflexota bacterium]
MMVARGEGPPELGVQIHAVTRGLAADTNAGPELQALGRALNAILSGDREPDLNDLPPPLAQAVRQVLAQVAAWRLRAKQHPVVGAGRRGEV